MIQRYDSVDGKIKPISGGNYVHYLDHLKEVERSNKRYVHELLKEQKFEGLEGEEELVQIQVPEPRDLCDIVKQAKAEVKAKQKAEKQPKTIKVMTLVKTSIATIILLAIGAYAGITINNAIESHIDSQVKAQVVEQVKSFTSEQN
jgi:hypothetical protein